MRVPAGRTADCDVAYPGWPRPGLRARTRLGRAEALLPWRRSCNGPGAGAVQNGSQPVPCRARNRPP